MNHNNSPPTSWVYVYSLLKKSLVLFWFCFFHFYRIFFEHNRRTSLVILYTISYYSRIFFFAVSADTAKWSFARFHGNTYPRRTVCRYIFFFFFTSKSVKTKRYLNGKRTKSLYFFFSQYGTISLQTIILIILKRFVWTVVDTTTYERSPESSRIKFSNWILLD